jgi:hypothetical protein
VSGSGHLFKGALLSGVGHPNLICLTIIHGFVPVGWQLVEELKGDEELRRALTEALGWRVPDNVATKDDIDSLKSYVDNRFDALKSYVNARFDDVNRRIDDLYGIVRASLVAIVVTLASTILVPLILRVLLGS